MQRKSARNSGSAFVLTQNAQRMGKMPQSTRGIGQRVICSREGKMVKSELTSGTSNEPNRELQVALK
jgi:hypothetical protein